MHVNAVQDLLHARSFALGLAYGGVAFLVAAVFAVVTRRRISDISGVVFVAAAWLGIRGAWGAHLASKPVALALVTLAVGGAIAGRLTTRIVEVGPRLAVVALAVTPGAIALAVVTPLAGSSASRTVLALSTIAFAVGVRDFDAINGAKGAPWLLFAISAGGVYLAVPDTELARVMLGVALPFVLLSIPKPICPFGPAGSAALAGLFTWVVVVGGRGRPGSVVGGLAAIGILVAEPIGRRLITDRMRRPENAASERRPASERVVARDRNQDSWLSAAAVAGIAQFVIALYSSRVVGRADAALSAIVIVAPMVAVAIIGAPELYPQPGQARRRRRRSSSRSGGHSGGRSDRHRSSRH